MRPRSSRDERTGYLDEREPHDPLTGASTAVVEAATADSAPVRHLAHRILEALS